MPDEFEIKATSPVMPDRIWTRNNLHASKMIADQAISRLGYAKAEVVNTFGGDRSDALYTVEEKKSMKNGDRVIWPAKGLHGTIKILVEGDTSPKPYAWVTFDNGDYEDIECRNLKPEVFGPCDACGKNACLTDEVICPTCKSAGKGKEGDNLSEKDKS